MNQPDERPQPAWRPLEPHERRVLGVLVEKAKTTPDAYPLTLNALRNGCNQKSNRDPQMKMDEDDVIDALETLRRDGAALEVHGDGRTARYRHAMPDWLGVDKVEAAVMTELLLRGAQTVGELRGRAARMSEIPDVAALQPVIEALKQRKLVVGLSPSGRGHTVTHGLYPPGELERVRSRFSSGGTGRAETVASAPATTAQAAPTASVTSRETKSPSADAQLANEMAQLRAEFAAAHRQMEETIEELRQRVDELERFRQDVGG